MIQFDPTPTNPSADRADAFVATGTALLLAGLAGAGVSAGTNIYAANKSSNAAQQAAALQTTASDKQLDYLKSKDAQDQANWEATQAENRRQVDIANQLGLDQYNAREDRLAPYRGIGSNATTTLNNLIGGSALPTSGQHLTLNSLPTSSISAPPPSSPSGPSGPASGSSNGTAADLKALIDSGIDPQQAAQQFNAKYGRTTGNEAAYYAPSGQTSGKAVIGLPDAYLSQEPSGWQVTQRAGGGAAPAASSSGASALAPTSFVDNSQVTPLTLNSIVPRTAALVAPPVASYAGPSMAQILALSGGRTLNNLVAPPQGSAFA